MGEHYGRGVVRIISSHVPIQEGNASMLSRDQKTPRKLLHISTSCPPAAGVRSRLRLAFFVTMRLQRVSCSAGPLQFFQLANSLPSDNICLTGRTSRPRQQLGALG